MDAAKPIHIESFPVFHSLTGSQTLNRGDTPIAEDISGGWTMLNRRPATGIEKCECPSKYKSASCQNPGIGFFRWYKVCSKSGEGVNLNRIQ